MQIIAHRGGAKEKPENSYESIMYSLNSKFDGIEIDIQFSKDNIPFINHDPFIGKILLENMTASEIKNKYTRLLRLNNVLNLIKGQKKVFFEIKGTYCPDRMKILNDFFLNYGDTYNFNFYLGSFNILYLINCHEKIKKMFITTNSFDLSTFEFMCHKINLQAVSLNYCFIENNILEYCNTNNIEVYIWTINNPMIFNNLTKKSELITGIITDYPLRYLKNKDTIGITKNNIINSLIKNKVNLNKNNKNIKNIKRKILIKTKI